MSRKYRGAFAMCLSMALGMTAMSGTLSSPQDTPPSGPDNPPAGDPTGHIPPRNPAPPANPPVAQPPSSGYIAAPPGSETLSETLGENSLHLFEADHFEGTDAALSGIGAAFTAGALNELPAGLNDSLTSLRWNLPPGTIVVFYEDAAGKGEQLTLWGKGQSPSVAKWDFNDKASRWAWYDVGGGKSARSAGSILLPHGATPPAETMPENSLQLFVDKNFANDMHQVAPLTAQKAGEMHKMPTAAVDMLTSLRWNLPDGVIVMLHQDADGQKQQAAIWGSGQIADLDVWDFNDKASRWSWSYVGAPASIDSTRDR